MKFEIFRIYSVEICFEAIPTFGLEPISTFTMNSGGLNHRELRVTTQDVKVIIATVSILLLINFFYTMFIENYNARHKTFTE